MGRDGRSKRQDGSQLREPDPGAVSGEAAGVQPESVVQLDAHGFTEETLKSFVWDLAKLGYYLPPFFLHAPIRPGLSTRTYSRYRPFPPLCLQNHY